MYTPLSDHVEQQDKVVSKEHHDQEEDLESTSSNETTAGDAPDALVF